MKRACLSIFCLTLFMNLFSQSRQFIAARTMALADIATSNLRYDPTRNIYIDNNKVIHVFLFEDGNLLLAGFPTTATEKNKYQVHLYVEGTNNDDYLFEYTGSFAPVLNIQSSNNIAAAMAPSIVALNFAIIGPFTNNLTLTLKHSPAGGRNFSTLVSTTIQIAKTIHASIGSGLLFTSLKNPTNIKKVPITPSSSDSTLLADDVKGRGVLTLFATYYPWGRENLMMPSWNFKDRFGIVVGTAISSGSSNFRDLFLGVQYDFSIGGSFVTGLHYGRRQKIRNVDYKNFEFGKTVFSGKIEDNTYTGWDPGFFIGVQVDSRIFNQLFSRQ